MFSQRFRWDLTPNALSQAVAARRAAGAPFLDLTRTNPTQIGLDYDDNLLAALRDPAALAYEPTAQGLLRAREAVAAYYGDAVHPDDIFLTASTSEAYSYLFKLLTDPGDEILVPRPSYPLFDFLAAMENVQVEPYPADVWDITHWRSTRTRALVTVHPNNPTGRSTHPGIAQACAEQGLPLIVDEVFLDYHWGPTRLASFVQSRPGDGVGFVLSGLSKVCALPQMKLGWIVLNGTNPAKREIRERLELVADTYLSASAPIQHAAPRWLAARHGIQEQIRRRIVTNLQALDASGLRRQPADGGWTAVVELSGTADEEALVLRFLNEANVLVQPGYFYDFPAGEALVVSLLSEPPEFAEGLNRMKQLGGIDGVFA